MQAVLKFVRVTSQLEFDVHHLSEAQLADTLTVMQLSRTSDTDRDVCSGNFTIKALRWWHKIAGVKKPPNLFFTPGGRLPEDKIEQGQA